MLEISGILQIGTAHEHYPGATYPSLIMWFFKLGFITFFEYTCLTYFYALLCLFSESNLWYVLLLMLFIVFLCCLFYLILAIKLLYVE